MPKGLQTLRRRIVSVPAIFLAFVLYAALLPALVLAGLVVGAARRDRWALARTLAMIGIYLTSEVVGITLTLLAWLASGAWIGLGHERRRRWYIVLQRWWTGSLFWGIRRCFSLKVDVEQWPSGLGDRRLLVLLRHASILDTLLAAALIANPLRLHLLYVFKRELLSDPCLDIVGGRLGCHFARRDSGESEQEVRMLRQLAAGLEPCEGVIIYPEGTRWTAAKQMRVLQRIRKSGNERVLELASRLDRLLPPRLGGPLALIEGAPDSDVVFIGHEGFEGAASLRDVMRGAMVGRTIRVAAWKVSAEEVPLNREEQVEWLYENWARMDAWLAHADAEDPTRLGAPPPGVGQGAKILE